MFGFLSYTRTQDEFVAVSDFHRQLVNEIQIRDSERFISVKRSLEDKG